MSTCQLFQQHLDNLYKTPTGVLYDYYPSRNGAYFSLYKTKDQTSKDITEAKQYLRETRDVLGIDVIPCVVIVNKKETK